LAFISADATADAEVGVCYRDLAGLILEFGAFFAIDAGDYCDSTLSLGEVLEMEHFHGAALDAESTADARFCVGVYAVVGGGEARGMSQLVIGLEPHAAALTAVADSVHAFLLV
jgi:hypothetical protein